MKFNKDRNKIKYKQYKIKIKNYVNSFNLNGCRLKNIDFLRVDYGLKTKIFWNPFLKPKSY